MFEHFILLTSYSPPEAEIGGERADHFGARTPSTHIEADLFQIIIDSPIHKGTFVHSSSEL
jgi:hypothetical protein